MPYVVSAYTEHKGVMTGDEVWQKAGAPHVIRATVIIPAGVTLTIDPGVVVAAAADAQLIVDGTLLIAGTAEERVLVTGYDNNQWGGILFEQHSTATLHGATFASSSPNLMRIITSDGIVMSDDSLQYSPIPDNADIVGVFVYRWQGCYARRSCGIAFAGVIFDSVDSGERRRFG